MSQHGHPNDAASGESLPEWDNADMDSEIPSPVAKYPPKSAVNGALSHLQGDSGKFTWQNHGLDPHPQLEWDDPLESHTEGPDHGPKSLVYIADDDRPPSYREIEGHGRPSKSLPSHAEPTIWKKYRFGFGLILGLACCGLLIALLSLAGTTNSPSPATPLNAESSAVPTAVPSRMPSSTPTAAPSATPVANPTERPTSSPTERPSRTPTDSPTVQPSANPSATPTNTPTTSRPSTSPSDVPTISPTHEPSTRPSTRPTTSPTFVPSATPTSAPTTRPSIAPSPNPTHAPSAVPTERPTPNLVVDTNLPPLSLDEAPDTPLAQEVRQLDPLEQNRSLVNLAALNQSSVWTDQSLHVDIDGVVLSADPPPATSRLTLRTRRQNLATYSRVDQYNIPIHHSKPGSRHTLFINVNGEVITGTAWNLPRSDSGASGAPITVSPFYNTGNVGPYTHTNAERDAITEIWMRVAEDFSPFDIDVTTEAPAACGSGCGAGGSCFACPDTVQVSTLAGGTVDATRRSSIGGVQCPSGGCRLPHPNAGGVAYLNVWRPSSRTISRERRPAFTYNGAGRVLRSQSAGVTVSHEAGHNFGLSHAGISRSGAGIRGSTSYLQGLTGSSGTVWGPIMGAPFGADVTQWTDSSYQGATKGQNEVGLLAADLGLISDAFSQPTSNFGTNVRMNGSLQSISGIIKSAGQRGRHLFTFDATSWFSGTLVTKTRYSGRGGSHGLNLAFEVTITSPTGGTICNGHVDSNFDSSTPMTTCTLPLLPPGTYTVQIQGTQSGESFYTDPLFSAAGSLGSYTMDFRLSSRPTPRTFPPTLSPNRAPTRLPTRPPAPSRSPSLSCVAGTNHVHKYQGKTETSVEVRTLRVGDVIAGACGEHLKLSQCKVAAIGFFGRGRVHGGFTADHYMLDNATKSLTVHGLRGKSEEADKYAVLLSAQSNADEPCVAGVDTQSNLYTAIDANFCGPDIMLSFSQYLKLYAAILRTVRQSGGYWLEMASYTDHADATGGVKAWADSTPELCQSMLRCVESEDKDSTACAEYEKVGATFVEEFLTPEAQNNTETAFPELGKPGAAGSVSFTAVQGSSKEGPSIVLITIIFALSGVIATGLVVAWRWRRLAQHSASEALAP